VSATGISLDVERELRTICGDEYVSERPSNGLYVSPATADEVAAVLVLANERQLTVGPAGGSTERSAAELHTDILLHINRLTQTEHYDHGDLTAGVGAGTTIAQLNAMVGADNLMFAGDPPTPDRCTVGGLLATASHGPLRHGYGAVRDYCIGVRFVTGDGRQAKGGGRVVKNVAGYDLMKLLIGSYGTLAVITSASFKLFPSPRQTQTFLAEFASAKQALDFRDLVARSPLSPMCLELISPGARKLMRPEMGDDAWVICLRAAGSDAVLARYRKELGTAITRELDGDGESKMWRAIENFPSSADGQEDGVSMQYSSARVQITVPPRDVLQVIGTLDNVASMDQVGMGMIGRVGVGHVLAAVWDRGPAASGAVGRVVGALGRSLGGGITVKVDGAASPWPIAPASVASMRAVKQALDPKNVLRGRETF
jgi:glycolate oxidase FAD binding subunit